MKPLLSSQCAGEIHCSQQYLFRLMHHQQTSTHLKQQISQIILNNSNPEALLQIAQTLKEAFQVDWCHILITAAESQNLAHKNFWSSDSDFIIPVKALELLQQLAIARADSQLFIFDDAQSADSIATCLPVEIGAVLGIPLLSEGEVIGVVSLVRSQPHHWSEHEVTSALAVATTVAIAVKQVLQNWLIATLQHKIQTSAQYQTLINQITMASRSSLDLNQIFQLALSRTAQALKVERGLIVTLKYTDPLFKTRQKQKKIPKARATVVSEWRHQSDDLAAATESLLHRSFWITESEICQHALLSFPQPLIISDHSTLAQINPSQCPLLDFQPLPTLVMFPLENQGTVLGFLVLYHRGERTWQADELTLLELVSTQVSTAIIQSETLRQVQSLVEERTAQLQRSLEVQAKLYEKTRQQIDQLRQLNYLKDEFVSTMNHELRTPLTSMSLAIRMLRQPGLPSERQAKYLDILEQQCTQEINLINDLLKLQELESHKALLHLENVDLKSKIDNLSHLFSQKWADKGLTFTVDLPSTPLVLQTDTESLERILQELLTNASKYSEPDSIVCLKAQHQDSHVVLELTNIGPSISTEDAAHMFDKFRRGQGVTQQAIQGTGLGLALVKCLVQHINGAIAVSSHPQGANISEICFTLTLPLTFNQAQS